MEAYNNYRAGFLPRAGGLYDQHCMFPKLMSILQGAFDKSDEIRREIADKAPSGGMQSILAGGM